ncbi:Cyclin-dependent kinase 6 [Fukomys damarensis]|uniref:Cyclin-dependent kinase 6 n=1 Tax=Fukomys damarensis TaxID=885580 RepID=A0A091D137_FUKDA|nr:Cyclin-dependent kinase 6 [Fukomys damarensis]
MPLSTIREVAVLRHLETFEHPNVVRPARSCGFPLWLICCSSYLVEHRRSARRQVGREWEGIKRSEVLAEGGGHIQYEEDIQYIKEYIQYTQYEEYIQYIKEYIQYTQYEEDIQYTQYEEDIQYIKEYIQYKKFRLGENPFL